MKTEELKTLGVPHRHYPEYSANEVLSIVRHLNRVLHPKCQIGICEDDRKVVYYDVATVGWVFDSYMKDCCRHPSL